MTRLKRNLLALTIIATVVLLNLLNTQINIFFGIDVATISFYKSIGVQVAKYLIPVIIILSIFHGPKNVLSEMGLHKNIHIGFGYAILFTLPMLIGYSIMGKFNAENTILENVVRAFKDGFREEIFYRAFLFGQLFRIVKLGFIPAVLINGLIFGSLHLYQAHTLAESVSVFAITFAGAVWFAWLYINWQQNLWVPIFIHFFMNLSWHLFSTEHSAVGGLMLNLPRIITIALSIYITIKLARKQGGLAINTSNLF